VQYLHGAVDDVSQVEFLPIDFAALLQHAAKSLDDIAGALIVVANVGEDLTDQNLFVARSSRPVLDGMLL
jgi:hypothetical protein